MAIFAYLVMIFMVIFPVWVIHWSYKNWNQPNRKKIIRSNLATLVVIMVGCWFAFPVWGNYLIYQKLWLNLFLVVPVLMSAGIVWAIYKLDQKRKITTPMVIVYGSVALALGGLGIIGFPSANNWQTASTNQPIKLEEPISADSKAVRFTPLSVAYQIVKGTFNSSQFTVMEEYMDPVPVRGGFGYVVPAVPDGVWPTMNYKVDGFVVYDDSFFVPESERTHRITQEFYYGEGMEWQDNIMMKLYRTDMFCRYTEVFYKPLDPEKPDELTAIAPKIKYLYDFPFFWVPTWGGVTLVHADGSAEDLSSEEVLADPRLDGLMLYPTELARELVDVQVYDAGYWGAYYNREGKIKVPELPGSNQMPFLMVAEDKTPYAVVAAEPSGDASALFRLYYINLANGEFSYYEYDTSSAVLGPRDALEQVRTSLKGYTWIDAGGGDGTTGNYRVIEPRPLPINDDLYWLTTITSASYKGINLTAVISASTRRVETFETRDEFASWLGLKTSENQEEQADDDSIEAVIDKAKVLFKRGLELLESIKER